MGIKTAGETPAYFSYWGKAKPVAGLDKPYHLLAYHSLDVAACGQALLRHPRFALSDLAAELGWALADVQQLLVFFLALHDLGKFSRAFQNLVPDLAPELVSADFSRRYTQRHDTLGWLLWRDDLPQESSVENWPEAGDEFWAQWMRAVAGHHGMPPREVADGGAQSLHAEDYFLPADKQAAWGFVADVAAHLQLRLPAAPGRKEREILRRYSWRLAGLAVLADWLGSNQHFFPYQDKAVAFLPEYWRNAAMPQAMAAVEAAGLGGQPLGVWQGPQFLFPYLREMTPLQHYAAEVELGQGAQLFLLEDVTGAGKTEAALILTQRLMAAGLAQGLYFALPSMATANQMYQRVGQMYQRLYAPGASPSLILAHGARELVEGFRQSVLQVGEPIPDRNYQTTEGSATAQCNAWLADHRKKALLADVGVGTLDQALLAILPARHQSMRLLGLAGKVLLVDEVHACDAYMNELLKKLLTAHARQGGSAILLSATLPGQVRADLAAAFRRGNDADNEAIADDGRYPLATHVHARVDTHACATRTQLRRHVRVAPVHTEGEVLALIQEQVAAGRSVCWIRNSVEDARRAYAAVKQRHAACLLFHSRYAMGTRLDIEDMALQRFGKGSTAAMRQGQVLIATQVVEQSLDLDFDVLISDLAPIDMLIQRAGRLQRHAREADGAPAADGVERRAAPVLHLFCPRFDEDPKADWYAATFPKAQYVYPDIGKLWLTQRALLAADGIASPGLASEAAAVRNLVEAVYGPDTCPVPEALQKASQHQAGEALADRSLANFNALKLDLGYCSDSSRHWEEDTRTPTRLGEDSVTVYLAREDATGLRPMLNAQHNAWEYSALRVDARAVKALEPEWLARFDEAIAALRLQHRLLHEPAFILPLMAQDGGWIGWVQDDQGCKRQVCYDDEFGLTVESAQGRS